MPVTSEDFVAKLLDEKIRINWSGRKRCNDLIVLRRL